MITIKNISSMKPSTSKSSKKIKYWTSHTTTRDFIILLIERIATSLNAHENQSQILNILKIDCEFFINNIHKSLMFRKCVRHDDEQFKWKLM